VWVVSVASFAVLGVHVPGVPIAIVRGLGDEVFSPRRDDGTEEHRGVLSDVVRSPAEDLFR